MIFSLVLIFIFGITYASQSAFDAFNVSTALVGVDEDAYGDTTFDSSNVNLVPILDSEVESNISNVIRIDFKVGGASNNNNDNIIYDIVLNDLEVSCDLLSPYIKWNLFKNGSQISNGSLDYNFDTIKNGRLILTNIQQDLVDYNSDKSVYDSYTFYMWVSDSCQESDINNCTDVVDQSSLLNKVLRGKIEVNLYSGNKVQLSRKPSDVLDDSVCLQ